MDTVIQYICLSNFSIIDWMMTGDHLYSPILRSLEQTRRTYGDIQNKGWKQSDHSEKHREGYNKAGFVTNGGNKIYEGKWKKY